MAIQKHILVLHKRKKQNANAMWVMVLGCLTLCSMTTLCLLFNDWSLLPQAYNPKPLILGEALFDLSPDLFPIHHPEIGKWDKAVNETKKRTIQLVKRCNDSSCLSLLNLFREEKNDHRRLTDGSSIEQMQGQEERSMFPSSSGLDSSRSTTTDSTDASLQSESETNSPSTKKRLLDFITVLMRKRSTNDDARPTFKMQKSLSLGSSERKEAKEMKERKKLLQVMPTQSEPSSPTSAERFFEVESKPRKSILIKSKSRKRFRPKEHVSFAVQERVQTIRNRVSPKRNILYNAESGQMRTDLKPDMITQDDHASEKKSSQSHNDKDRLVKRSGLPPLAATNQDNAYSLSQFESDWHGDPNRRIRTSRRSSRPNSPAASQNESPGRSIDSTFHVGQSRRASYNDVHDLLSLHRNIAEQDDVPLSQYDTGRHARPSSRRMARTPSPKPSPSMASEGRTVERGSPAHAISPYHEKIKVEGGPGRGRRHSFDSVSEGLDKLGDSSPSTPSSPFSPFAEARKSSVRSRESPRARRVSFEGTDDYRSRGSSSSPRIVSNRREGHTEGLLDALHISSVEKRKKEHFQKRSEFGEEASQAMKRCFGSDCLSSLKPKDKLDDVELLPLKSKNLENRKSKLSKSSSIPPQSDVEMNAPQRQTFSSSTRAQSPLSSANRDRDLRKYTLMKNVLSPTQAIKLVKRGISSDEGSIKSHSSISSEKQASPRLPKSILRTKDRTKNENSQLRRVTFSEETKFTTSNKPRPSFRRSGSSSSKHRMLYSTSKQPRRSSTLPQRSSTFDGRIKAMRISDPALSGSVQATTSTELNRSARRPYVSSNTRFTSQKGRSSSSIVRRSDRTSTVSSQNIDSQSSASDETLSRNNSSGSNFSKRAESIHSPTKSSLRPKDAPRTKAKKHVTFGGESSIDIPDQPSSPRSPTKHVTDMFATKPTVLYDASKQHQTTTSSTSLHVQPSVSPSTTSISSKSYGSRSSRPSTSSSHSTSYGSRTKSRDLMSNLKSGRKYYKRDLLEKRAKKRKLRTVPSSESFIHTADHHARYGASTSAAAPTKKMKQQPQLSATTSDLSPSKLGFAGLHITSNAGSLSTSSRDSVSSRQLQRSDSLRSTGSSSFRRLDSSPQHFHTSPQVSRPGSPASPSAQHGEWWTGGHSGTSSSGGVPFVY
ncbi:uncharacterized protein FA14DRAFT_8034 [Meira miltonrushii]|uniref:Uncharacterized protein n=1 Tax=Meira miltonrushii TaxID=1280837 RepID=A0A316VHC0_9BASI|nr:uncharacterized protein FA14DRAFT_8034 [Meira miltonrushii]PWN36920.1 hypothetical protein FA14DRAFT_8034 [Meira miltonrushii]